MDVVRETAFIQTFVQRERRERSALELTSLKKRGRFINSLCHSYQHILDMRYAKQITGDKKSIQHSIIQSFIHRGTTETVYIISANDSMDGLYLGMEEAIHAIYFYGLPSILLHPSSPIGYFQAEQEVGSPPRYLLEHPSCHTQ